MSRPLVIFACLFAIVTACSGNAGDGSAGGSAAAATPGRAASRLVEGKDYVVLERVRVIDSMGFDQPVEAMSVLLPKGWRTDAGIRWKNVNECRSEIVSWHMSATSPDGEIRFSVLPVRSFDASQNEMMHQALVAESQQGGCAISTPFDATRYIEMLARDELGGATVSDVRRDESLQSMLDKISAQSDAASQQYGTGMRQTGTAVYGKLSWPDGSRGLANVGVSVMETPGVDMYGAPNGFASTMVFHRAVIRYAPAREAEALKLFATITTSHRMNPVWQQAKDGFLTRLGNVEHAGRMERIRLMGEQSAAYAKAQSEAADARMRDWERAQASSDGSQRRFIQTIREVETWKDASGSPVELGAGYSHGFSRPDGSIILTNNSLFDPAVELQQSWTKMEKVRH